MTDEELRKRILDLSPELRLDVKVLTDILRKQVEVERDKAGFNHYSGKIVLAANKDKETGSKQPDLIGSGRVAGHLYRFAGWINGTGIEIVYEEIATSKHHNH